MIAGLKPYAEYKDSAVPWLGQVPEHWQVVRSKRLFTARKDLAKADDPQLSATQAYGVIEQADFERRSGHRVVKISMHLDKRKHVERDDFVISMRSFQGGIERAWATGAIRSSYVVLRPSSDVCATYFQYLLKSPGYIRALQATGDFIRDGQDLNFGNFARVDLPLVPKEEQVAIGRFIDWASNRLERAIRLKRKAIALLVEQKHAVIHHAVTCGLKSGVQLKATGVPWLSEIPSHWEMRRLRTLVSRIDQGVSPQAAGNLAEGESWGVLKSGCVNRGIFRETEHKRLPHDFVVDPSIAIAVGDVLISRACGSPSLVGSVGRVRSLRYRLILSDKTFRAKFRDTVDADFMVYAMNSRYYRHQVEQAISGAEGMANNLPLSSLRDFRFAIPPKAEAVEIAGRIQRETAGVDARIEHLEAEIELLREYRTRLVADVVTGQLDVREAALHLPADAPPDLDVEPGDEVDDTEFNGEEVAEA